MISVIVSYCLCIAKYSASAFENVLLRDQVLCEASGSAAPAVLRNRVRYYSISTGTASVFRTWALVPHFQHVVELELVRCGR